MILKKIIYGLISLVIIIVLTTSSSCDNKTLKKLYSYQNDGQLVVMQFNKESGNIIVYQKGDDKENVQQDFTYELKDKTVYITYYTGIKTELFLNKNGLSYNGFNGDGVNSYIMKPYDEVVLNDKVKNFLKK